MVVGIKGVVDLISFNAFLANYTVYPSTALLHKNRMLSMSSSLSCNSSRIRNESRVTLIVCIILPILCSKGRASGTMRKQKKKC